MSSQQDILEDAYRIASDPSISDGFISDESLSKKVEFICRNNSNKAPIRFLMSCLLAKLDRENVDIRKPYTEIGGKDCYSGRYYDEQFIEEFIRKYKLPCNSTTAYLTPAFRNIDRILTIDLVLVGRPKEVYTYTLEILDAVYMQKEHPHPVLIEIIRNLVVIKSEDEKRMDQLLKNITQTKDFIPLSSEEIVLLLTQHLNSRHSSRLPVLMIAAAYKTIEEMLGLRSLSLNAHNAADKQTGSFGDVEITLANDDNVITCYEMKDKKVTKNDIDHALEKIIDSKIKIDNYIFITTDLIESDISDYAITLYDKTGIEFHVFDCIGFIRHFLHFFHRWRSQFLDTYQAMVLSEPTSAVSNALKELFLALRKNAESDR